MLYTLPNGFAGSALPTDVGYPAFNPVPRYSNSNLVLEDQKDGQRPAQLSGTLERLYSGGALNAQQFCGNPAAAMGVWNHGYEGGPAMYHQQPTLQLPFLHQPYMLSTAGTSDAPFVVNMGMQLQNFPSPVESTMPSNTDEHTKRPRKPRIVWTQQLHARFVAAVHKLGVNEAVPKAILKLINVPGMTRENVASHLQKYRLGLLRKSKSKEPAKPDTLVDPQPLLRSTVGNNWYQVPPAVYMPAQSQLPNNGFPQGPTQTMLVPFGCTPQGLTILGLQQQAVHMSNTSGGSPQLDPAVAPQSVAVPAAGGYARANSHSTMGNEMAAATHQLQTLHGSLLPAYYNAMSMYTPAMLAPQPEGAVRFVNWQKE